MSIQTITITNGSKAVDKCCGCTACQQACPKHCISMQADEHGFLHPHVDEKTCIECRICERVCPVISSSDCRYPLKVYAATNNDESIRIKSSSGGVFMALAEYIIRSEGVVFGARFDEEWNVVHDYAENIEGLAAFRGSKYVQSNMGDCFSKVKKFLKAGRKVMFTGTPCQALGLRRFLGKDYENLIVIDVVCHGVPSPLVWHNYVEFLKKRPQGVAGRNLVSLSLNEMPLTGISFRDKRLGWKKFGFTAHWKSASKADQNMVSQPIHNDLESQWFEPFQKNIYMRGFLNNLYLRNSCFACTSRGGRSLSDITLGDYWGIERVNQKIDINLGVGLVMLYTPKGENLYNSLHLRQCQTTYDQALKGNPCIEHSVKKTKYVEEFWKRYFNESLSAIVESIERRIKPNLLVRILRKLKKILTHKR